jgi:hypothetical protein
MKKKVIGIVVDPQVYHKFKVKVVSENKRISSVIEELMKQYLGEQN